MKVLAHTLVNIISCFDNKKGSSVSSGVPATPAELSATRRRDGFSLIELLVGITIFGLVVGTSFAALGQGFQMVENSRVNKAASEILQLFMEDLRLDNWSEINDLGASGSFSVSDRITALKERLRENYPDYFNENSQLLSERYFDQVFYTISDEKAGQKKITLSVSWNDSRGIYHFREYTTYYTELGLHDYLTRSL